MINIKTLFDKKKNSEKISMVTAYDYISAKIVDSAGVDIILVGDSLGMVIQGEPSTLQVTMDEMIYHTKIVGKTAKNSFVLADMPFLSYHASVETAVLNAGRFIKETYAKGVKLEGGKAVLDKIEAISKAEIPVMAHLGLTPQSINKLGSYSVQGKSAEEEEIIISDAKAVEAAGAFAILLECVPESLSKKITKAVSIPTIGCGAGRYCDGHVLVFHDMLGFREGKPAKFVKQYANLFQNSINGIEQFKYDVDNLVYPSDKETYH